jgi:mono/diheme cytochrome c family protein
MAEWKDGSALESAELDAVADFVADFAKIPPDVTPAEWRSTPGLDRHPGFKPFQEECGPCHVIDGFTKGGERRAPGLFAWGSSRWTARMIRKPSVGDLYGFLKDRQKMPPFGPDQMSDNDLDMVIRYLRGDYPRPVIEPNPAAGAGAPAARTGPAKSQ